MPKKLYTSVPPRYEVCLHADCPKADVCLHQIAYQKLLSEQTFGSPVKVCGLGIDLH